MEINQLIGETAGQVWHVLNSDGPQTLPQLKRKLDGTGPFVDFAVGWLVREEKVEIDREKKSLRLRLRWQPARCEPGGQFERARLCCGRSRCVP